MLKKILLASLVILGVYSCTDNPDKIYELQKRVTELEEKADSTYMPGLGEMMINVQLHHAKLWFAGKNKNWRLAYFELDELKELFRDIQKYETAREETKIVPIIYPPLDSVRVAVNQKNPEAFENSFSTLTKTCNSCHKAVNFEFNKVKIPETPPFSNQEFRPENSYQIK